MYNIKNFAAQVFLHALSIFDYITRHTLFSLSAALVYESWICKFRLWCCLFERRLFLDVGCLIMIVSWLHRWLD